MQWSRPKVLASISQITVGLLFLFSGIVKGIDPIGTAIKIGEYTSTFGIVISDRTSLIASVFLNVLESTIGLFLLIGWRPKLTRWIALVVMLGMTFLTLYIYLFDPVADCGCFGDVLIISNAATFWKNIVLLTLVIYLFRHPGQWHEWLPLPTSDWIISLGMVLLLLFNKTNIDHLPVIDFRPYKIGSDLMELTTTGGTDGEYIYEFVYKKDGEERIFTIDQISHLDSTWVYVRDEIKVLREATRPQGADFVMLRDDGTDMVESLSQSDGEAILLISPDLTLANPELLKEITEKCQRPISIGISNTVGIWDDPKYSLLLNRFAETLFIDKSTAQTVIRSNPGVLMIKEGKILDKLSAKDFLRKLDDPIYRQDPLYNQYEESKNKDFLRYYGIYLIAGILYVIAVLVLRVTNKRY